MALSYVSLLNRSGGAASVGIGVRIPNHLWVAGQWVNATTTFTDDTVDAQDTGSADFALETLTINDGYIVASRVPFNAILLDIGTASNLAAGDPVRAARYTNTATTWAALTTVVLTGAAAEYSTTVETVVAWDLPTDWVVTSLNGPGTGIPADVYAINVRATTTPDTTAGVANSMSIYRIYFIESIANNATKEINLNPAEAWMPHGDALVGFFSVANASNKVTALVRPRS